jgi:quinol monooxygenase YgiN
MIERHITFEVLPDRTTDFERFIAERYRPATSETPGYLRLDLLREADHPTRYQMVFRWADAAAAVAWRTSAAHQALQPALSALVSSTGIQAYEVLP